MKTMLKILLFLALMGAYLLWAGAPAWDTLFGRKLLVTFGLGAALALWGGGEPIGTLQPVTLRPLFIILGSFLMLAMFVWMLASRDVARRLEHAQSVPKGHAGQQSQACFRAARYHGTLALSDASSPFLLRVTPRGAVKPPGKAGKAHWTLAEYRHCSIPTQECL